MHTADTQKGGAHGLAPVFCSLALTAALSQGCVTSKTAQRDDAGRTAPPPALAIDQEGNAIFGGTYSGDLPIARGLPGVAPSQKRRGYVVKHAGGAAVWAAFFDGDGRQQVTSVTTDAGGNVFVAGIFSREVSLEGDVIKNEGGPEPQMGFFAAKLDPQGKKIWLRPLARVALAERIQITIGGTPPRQLLAVTFYRGSLRLDGQPSVWDRSKPGEMSALSFGIDGRDGPGRVLFSSAQNTYEECVEYACAAYPKCENNWTEACWAFHTCCMSPPKF